MIMNPVIQGRGGGNSIRLFMITSTSGTNGVLIYDISKELWVTASNETKVYVERYLIIKNTNNLLYAPIINQKSAPNEGDLGSGKLTPIISSKDLNMITIAATRDDWGKHILLNVAVD